MRALFLALLRYQVAVKARRLARRGSLVLADRWPTTQVGKMDGPKITVSSRGSKAVKFLAFLERGLYRALPEADVCVMLVVPVQEAVQRNRSRDKVGKESDSEILARHEANANMVPHCRDLEVFVNSGSYQEMLPKLIDIIWRRVSERQRSLINA